MVLSQHGRAGWQGSAGQKGSKQGEWGAYIVQEKGGKGGKMGIMKYSVKTTGVSARGIHYKNTMLGWGYIYRVRHYISY